MLPQAISTNPNSSSAKRKFAFKIFDANFRFNAGEDLMNQNKQQPTKQDSLIDDLTVREDQAAAVNGGRTVASREGVINYTGLE